MIPVRLDHNRALLLREIQFDAATRHAVRAIVVMLFWGHANFIRNHHSYLLPQVEAPVSENKWSRMVWVEKIALKRRDKKEHGQPDEFHSSTQHINILHHYCKEATEKKTRNEDCAGAIKWSMGQEFHLLREDREEAYTCLAAVVDISFRNEMRTFVIVFYRNVVCWKAGWPPQSLQCRDSLFFNLVRMLAHVAISPVRPT